MSKNGSDTTVSKVEGGSPDIINNTTSPNTLVVVGEVVSGGVAPMVVREQVGSPGQGLRQPLITELLAKPVLPELAGFSSDDDLRECIGLSECTIPGEEEEFRPLVRPGDDESVSKLCEGVRTDDEMLSGRGMNNDYPNNVECVKDLCDPMVEPSVDNCEYKRGFCLLHKMKGIKQT